MSASTTIKLQLIDKIDALSSVQKVYGHEENNPPGWPAVFIKPANMEGEFSSNQENSRVYSYYCICLFPLGQDFIKDNSVNREEYAEQVVAEVADEIIDAVDTDYELDGTPVLFVNAADIEWGTYDYEGGKAKAVQITLRVYTEKVVNYQ